jgi:endonuclease YncB( thermonuclease family)
MTMNHPIDLRPVRARRSRRLGRHDLAALAVGLVAGAAGGLAWTLAPQPPAPPAVARLAAVPAVSTVAAGPAPRVRASFGFCHVGGGANCVVDGDTFWMSGEKIRIADIDTPETHPARCPREAELGAAATRRLHALLNGGAVTLESAGRDADRYGRKLRLVAVDGRGVGGTLIAEGLARPYEGGRRAGWCEL